MVLEYVRVVSCGTCLANKKTGSLRRKREVKEDFQDFGSGLVKDEGVNCVQVEECPR